MTELPWLQEPSHLTWVDPHTRLRCLIRRHPTMGHLCGYVCIPASHPLYTKTKGFIQKTLDEVHGGVTYDRTQKQHKTRFMGRGRWVGFDCAHAGDYLPGMSDLLSHLKAKAPEEVVPLVDAFKGDVYRDINYVIGVVTCMAHDIGGTRGL